MISWSTKILMWDDHRAKERGVARLGSRDCRAAYRMDRICSIPLHVLKAYVNA